MSDKLKKIALKLGVVLFWVGVWYIAAILIDSVILLPNPRETVIALFALMRSGEFYLSILFTLIRVIIGLLIGILLGVTLAILSFRFEIIKSFIKPIVSVIRAIPVASFIVLLWVLLDGDMLNILVAVLMVMPIVWQNTIDGFSSVPKELTELLEIYPVSFIRRFKALYMPVLKGYIFPAIVMSVGLAWKAEIASEIIAYTANSIGMYINDAKSVLFDYPQVFAWTLVIIVMSLLLEKITRKLLGGKS